MSVSGIGSSTYIYNIKTGKLASKDGSKDDFVDYFNGDTTGKQTDSLNGFDARKKSQINSMVRFYQSMGSSNRKGLFTEQNGDEYEITCDVVDAVTTQYSVNGEKVFKAYDMNVYTYINGQKAADALAYRLHGLKNEEQGGNSIRFGAGDVFELGNGYSLKITDCSVEAEGLGSGSEQQDQKAQQLAYGMNALIRFAAKQWAPDRIDSESTPMLLSMLRELGIDTDKTFQINGTRCEVRNGRIAEAGKRFGMPESVFEEAVKKYEEALSMPIA